MGYTILPPDINESGEGFVIKGTAFRYGLLGIKGVGEGAVKAILENRPYTSFDDFREKVKGTPCNAGPIKVLSAVGAFDSMVNRKALDAQLEQEKSGESTTCSHKTSGELNEHNLPCVFDWANEPVELTPKGKPKVRSIPKRCTKACRNYDPKGLVFPEGMYAPSEIMEREMEYLGIWLTFTPFDRIPPEEKDLLYTAEEIESLPPGEYLTACLVNSIGRVKTKANQEDMAIIHATALTSGIEFAMFPKAWAEYGSVVKVNHLGLYLLQKNNRGLSCNVMVAV